MILERLVLASIRLRFVMIALLIGILGLGVVAARSLPIDAIPDVSTVQVSVLTEAPGLSPVEVECTVTLPIELALNGTPRLTELRSVSRLRRWGLSLKARCWAGMPTRQSSRPLSRWARSMARSPCSRRRCSLWVI